MLRLPADATGRGPIPDIAACRALLVTGSRTFLAASRVLPRRVRDPAIALYAFCRVADDAIDLGKADGTALAEVTARLDAIYRGEPQPHPADRAFAAVVEHFAIPRALPEALIEGFAWDTQGRRYETLSDVLAYATRVAGSVGTMMALLMGVRAPELLARACDLGIAMQLSNIARDVGEDARAGRLYLPLAVMRREKIDPEAFLREPVSSPHLKHVVGELLSYADNLYQRAESGIASLPVDCRTGIFAACFLYAEIGNEVRRNGFDSISQRAIVPAKRKVELVARAALATSVSLARPSRSAHDCVPEAAFLIDAVPPLQPSAWQDQTEGTAWWDFSSRTARVIEILEKLERQDREARRALHDTHRTVHVMNSYQPTEMEFRP